MPRGNVPNCSARQPSCTLRYVSYEVGFAKAADVEHAERDNKGGAQQRCVRAMSLLSLQRPQKKFFVLRFEDHFAARIQMRKANLSQNVKARSRLWQKAGHHDNDVRCRLTGFCATVKCRASRSAVPKSGATQRCLCEWCPRIVT
eukprot:3416320-Pleurochrysis_carterae.AAC.2